MRRRVSRWGEEGGPYAEIVFAYAQLMREDEDSDVEQGAPPAPPTTVLFGDPWKSVEIMLYTYMEFHGNP